LPCGSSPLLPGLAARAPRRRALIARPLLPCPCSTSHLSRSSVALAILAIVAAAHLVSRPARARALARLARLSLPAAPPPGVAPAQRAAQGCRRGSHCRRRLARRRPRRHPSPPPRRYAPRRPVAAAAVTLYILRVYLLGLSVVSSRRKGGLLTYLLSYSEVSQSVSK